MNSDRTTALELLEKLRFSRGDRNPFASNVDFYRWADEVAGLLMSCDLQAYRVFISHVEAVQSAYAFNLDLLDSINKAIVFVNEVVFALRHEA